MRPLLTNPDLMAFLIDFSKDFFCWFGPADKDFDIDKDEFAKLFILATRRDDWYESAEYERIIWEGMRKFGKLTS